MIQRVPTHVRLSNAYSKYIFDLLVATTGLLSQPDRNNELHENWLLTSWILYDAFQRWPEQFD